ncbi:MAG: hypothetical protein ACK4K7_13685 [Allosphingosinicella sp.]
MAFATAIAEISRGPVARRSYTRTCTPVIALTGARAICMFKQAAQA